MMLAGCRAALLRPIGLARTTGKIALRESRDSLGGKWKTGRLMPTVETQGKTGHGMFGPPIPEGRTIGERERRRRAGRVAVSGPALLHHLIVGAAGRSRGVVVALMRVGGTDPREMAVDGIVKGGFYPSILGWCRRAYSSPHSIISRLRSPTRIAWSTASCSSMPWSRIRWGIS